MWFQPKMRKNDWPIVNGLILMKLNSTHDVARSQHSRPELLLPYNICFSGKGTAYLKAIAHVSQNVLYSDNEIYFYAMPEIYHYLTSFLENLMCNL
jgi:hypothetical protein